MRYRNWLALPIVLAVAVGTTSPVDAGQRSSSTSPVYASGSANSAHAGSGSRRVVGPTVPTTATTVTTSAPDTTNAATSAPDTVTTATTSAPDTVSSPGVSIVPTGPVFSPTVSWSPCGAGVECGVLTTLLDPTDPGSPKVQVGAARRSARTLNRIGILLVNPGGPAGSAVDMVTDPGLERSMPPLLRGRFDVIGIDPRGTARSVPVLCAGAPNGSNDEERAKSFSASFGARSGSILPFVGTDLSADDLEAMRIALGEQQISYLGFSWGTYLGGLYAQKYPDRVRSMILDGGVDPTRFGVAAREDQMRAQERTLTEFLAACERSSTRSCPLKTPGKTTKLRYEEMLLIASRTGIGREKIDRDDLEALTGILLGEDWSVLARALGELSKGGTALTLSILDYLNGDPNSRYEDGGYEGIACRDGFFASAHPEEAVSVAARAERYRAAAPHFLNFAGFWASEATCTSWAAPPRPRAPFITTAGPRIMVIGNTLDLRTPIEWSRSIATQLGARMVSFDDYVHTASFSGETCITNATSRWLIDLIAPPAEC